MNPALTLPAGADADSCDPQADIDESHFFARAAGPVADPGTQVADPVSGVGVSAYGNGDLYGDCDGVRVDGERADGAGAGGSGRAIPSAGSGETQRASVIADGVTADGVTADEVARQVPAHGTATDQGGAVFVDDVAEEQVPPDYVADYHDDQSAGLDDDGVDQRVPFT